MIRMFAAVFRSFGHAFWGIGRTILEERNFRIHLVAVVLVTWFAVLYEVTALQGSILVVLYGMVLSLELINTAVEHTVDLVTKEWSPLAKKAKDAAAGGVLIAALASVIVAVILFRDPVHWSIVLDKLSSPVRIAVLVVFIVGCFFFVRGKGDQNRESSSIL